MDQRLNSFSTEVIRGLSTFCKSYFNECLHRKDGHNIIYLINAETCKFGSYVSTNYELGELVNPELSKEESADDIVYVVDCYKFRSYDNSKLSEMSYDMEFLLFGFISGINVNTNFKLSDTASEFLDNINY